MIELDLLKFGGGKSGAGGGTGPVKTTKKTFAQSSGQTANSGSGRIANTAGNAKAASRSSVKYLGGNDIKSNETYSVYQIEYGEAVYYGDLTGRQINSMYSWDRRRESWNGAGGRHYRITVKRK